MDALGPSAIPHSPKTVPILNKKVSAKVFNSIFPLAHVSNGNQVTLINPNGVDLKSYEERLRGQINVYWDRLTKLAWDVIPSEKRGAVITECGHEELDVTDPLLLAYREHRDVLRNAMEELGWPRPKVNFDLLEAEIHRAENFIKYSESLREEAGRRRTSRERGGADSRLKSHSVTSTRTQDDIDGNLMSLSHYVVSYNTMYFFLSSGGSSISLFSPTSSSSLIELLDQLELHTATPSPSPSPRLRSTCSSPAAKKPCPMRQNLRSQKVIARSSEDGFYYPGLVLSHTDSRHITVQFADHQQFSILRKFVIPIGGAAPCPVLQIDDHVLVQVRTRRGPHPSQGGSCDYFIPGTIQVLPENSRVGRALHTVLVFNGRTVTCPRKGVVKITESLYKTVCKFINLKMSKFHSKVEQESEHGEYASDFSDERSTQRSNSNSRRSSTHTPLTTSPAHSSHIYSSVETERSKSRLSEDGPTEHDGGMEKDSPRNGHGAGGIQSLLESQQTQCELLERYQRDLEELQERQRLIEEQMRRKNSDDGGEGRFRRKERSHTEEEVDVGNILQVTESESGRHVPQCCEQGVNTGPWMEEKAVETDPMTESRGVGTEWPTSSSSDSEGEEQEREGEREGEGEGEREEEKGEEASNELPSRQTTRSPSLSPVHASTPLPSSPTHSVPSSPSSQSTPKHILTPSPSHKSTPTPSPSHKSTPTPSPSHKSTPTPSPSHKSTPSLIPVHTASTAADDPRPEEQTDSILTEAAEKDRDLSSIAQRLVELGIDAFVGLEVLARWPDDGWCYRAKVVRSVGQHRYQVMDACGDLETIHLSDMITDTQDAETLLQVRTNFYILANNYK